ncbi:tRNA (guanosine(37)-N1)-methyltransferase TrmD [Saccharibacter sp. 17.LH.SD]|uniref:tRNA (guanosine(37)-N1)-methyltransferase TrmD n=1 Tax=Saccharibacter sp. 17.LH.SD TaxID=2689393 RepID=UPI00136EF563|nr:tRNA (guanosine(37)-N1)-methyltransferase TrmD [Saccharibacter sp. 17.LH.SD]MXV44729.1 tRNA (guanosine(37)-N1)-methyltransferase TrmD [Saccharibacter sp. 17.LH.SD]
MTWQADILTLFPEMFPGPLGYSLAGRALEAGLWSYKAHDLRLYGRGRHRALDDTPFGGGAGMVMRPDVLDQALEDVKGEGDCPIIYPTPRGVRLSQKDIKRFTQGSGVVLLCGRFEGVDERVLEKHGVEQYCMGDFVLSGGEIPALALLDGCVRLLPGVMGSAHSGEEESFSDGLLEYPHYTRPSEWEGREVPPVLLSGNHKDIARWRHEESIAVTRARRPDLWARHEQQS